MINQQQHGVVGIDHCVNGVAHGFVSFFIQIQLMSFFPSYLGRVQL
jgi:hypothetical protein